MPMTAKVVQRAEVDADTLILYDDGSDFSALIKKAESLRKKGQRVRVQREAESDLTSREVIRLDRGARA